MFPQVAISKSVALRVVEMPERDEDGEPISTMIVDWLPNAPGGASGPGPDPWAQGRREGQRSAVLRLKRILMGALAEHGVEREIPPNGPTVWMIDQEVVRKLFYEQTLAEGTPKQKYNFRRARFNRALDWAESEELIGRDLTMLLPGLGSDRFDQRLAPYLPVEVPDGLRLLEGRRKDGSVVSVGFAVGDGSLAVTCAHRLLSMSR